MSTAKPLSLHLHFDFTKPAPGAFPESSENLSEEVQALLRFARGCPEFRWATFLSRLISALKVGTGEPVDPAAIQSLVTAERELLEIAVDRGLDAVNDPLTNEFAEELTEYESAVLLAACAMPLATSDF